MENPKCRLSKIKNLKIGTIFSLIPTPWYGTEKVISITKREESVMVSYLPLKFGKKYSYDLKCDAAVVNPPAVHYGIPENTEIFIYD